MTAGPGWGGSGVEPIALGGCPRCRLSSPARLPDEAVQDDLEGQFPLIGGGRDTLDHVDERDDLIDMDAGNGMVVCTDTSSPVTPANSVVPAW